MGLGELRSLGINPSFFSCGAKGPEPSLQVFGSGTRRKGEPWLDRLWAGSPGDSIQMTRFPINLSLASQTERLSNLCNGLACTPRYQAVPIH